MAKTPADISDEISSEANIVSFVVRHYFTNFDEIPAFLLEYLKSIE